MKKILIVSLLLITLNLSSCSLKWESEDVQDAKRELLWENYQENNTNDDIDNIKDKDNVVIIEDKIEKILVTKEFITDEEYFSISDIDKPTNKTTKIDFNWKTEFLIDKIEVTFKNENSSFPYDDYTLQSFKTWNKDFIYRAYKEYEVLDFWINEYIITAYFWDKVSKMKIIIEIPETEENIDIVKNEEYIDLVNKTIWKEEDNIFLKLPENEIFGDIIMMWEDSFTYSNIENFEVVKSMEIFDKTCDNLTDYLINKFGYTYRNTCRQLNIDNWITFNVLRLNWDKYYYERHYLDQLHGLYWIYEIESWTWIDKDNIWDKNSELKLKEFDWISKVDDLFNIIAK